jgi:hypothetical protein
MATTSAEHGSMRAWVRHATPVVLCRLTLWAFLALLVSTTLADADLWGHLRFGLDMLASKALHTSDPYSFTADRPWLNHEWLSELLMGIAYTWLGPLGLGLLKLAAIGVVTATLVRVAVDEHATPLARDLFVVLAVFATYSRTQVVRPQLFSVALFCVLLYLLRLSDRGRQRALWGVPLCFGVWANLHGGWIVGLAVLGVWSVGDAWQHRGGRRLATLTLVGAVSLAATLVNPYGFGLWQFIAETVRPARPDITDWKPLLHLPPSILAIEAILPAIALVALWKARPAWRIPLRNAAVLGLLVVATFRVGRVDAFLQAAIAFLLSSQIVGLFNRLDVRLRPSFRRPSLAVGAFAVALVIYVGIAAVANLRVIRVEGYWIPDRTAALLLRDARPGARVLTWFDWGEYALWQLSPAGIRVSMDGRRETVYSERVTADHQRFYAGQLDMVDYPDRIGADHVWLPSNFPIIDPLMRNGWRKVLDTGQSVILARTVEQIEYRAAPIEKDRLFPWP